MKSLLHSRTFWLAVLQGVIAIVVVFNTTYPQWGWLLMAKSVLDIVLRMVTTEPVTVV